ncbi:MAG: lysoplasmalogenase [Deltaproteobacteria bacterium]|jgi:uncharacterized membrane protein YhhN|nr:lysoplasmalogenase [Deltaproteobacteria bacterium]MBW2532314.1 lysoplasmalogenase [Deltaproteobacteria bacterium]
MVEVALTGLCAAATIALVIAEVRRSRRGRYVSKPLASAAFVLLAVMGGALDQPGAFGAWIVAGLVLGAAGDVALMFPSNRAFLTGLVLFLLGHVAYVVAFGTIVPLAAWLHPLALLPIAAGAAVLRYLWRHLGPMRAPVVAYTVVIVLMVVGAIAPARVGPDLRTALTDGAAWLLLAGALAFFVSDIAVARDRFVAKGPANRIWGLPAYYAGQLLIAWSALPLGGAGLGP